jgi:hypothetical protein
MKFKEFEELILSYKKMNDTFSKLSDVGFDFYENKTYPLIEMFEDFVNKSFKLYFNELGSDWIWWFMFENDYGNKKSSDVNLPEGYNAFDDSSGEKIYICYDFKSLYTYLKENKYIKK